MSLVRLNLFFTKFITARKRSLGQGNIFIGVCQEFCSQGGYLLRGVPAPGGCSQGGVPAPQMGGACSCPGGGGVPAPGGVAGGDPPKLLLLRAVRILLECILINLFDHIVYLKYTN